MVVFKNVRISLLNVKTWKKSFGETQDRKTSTTGNHNSSKMCVHETDRVYVFYPANFSTINCGKNNVYGALKRPRLFASNHSWCIQ